MESKHLIDIAYQFAKEKFEGQTFTYENLWTQLIKKAKLSNQEQEENIGVLYTNILQDPRFIFIGNKDWKLKEFIKREEIASLENSLYNFNNELEQITIDADDNDVVLADIDDDYIKQKAKFKTNLNNIDDDEEEEDIEEQL